MDETDGTEAGMDLAQDVEGLGVPALEIDGNDRETGFPDQFDAILRPRDIFHDMAFLLPRTHLPGREQAQGLPVSDMSQGDADTGNTPGTAGGEIVHGNKTVLEAGNE